MVENSENLQIDLTWHSQDWPDRDRLEVIAAKAARTTWCQAISPAATRARQSHAELSIVFADDAFVQNLNCEWRDKDSPTNVLSFPAMDDAPIPGQPVHIGDVVVALETVMREADVQKKLLQHHLAHLICHGTLHLLDYDHMTDNDAEVMESLESKILASLGVPNPYLAT